MKLLLLLLLTFAICKAPEYRTLYIERAEKISKYDYIWKVICQVESNNDPLAYHMEEDGWPAVGISQIRWVRLKDYNGRTGHNYKMKDMYDPIKNRQVFMYYANLLDDPDKIIRKWNGSGHKSYKYLKRVQAILKSTIP